MIIFSRVLVGIVYTAIILEAFLTGGHKWQKPIPKQVEANYQAQSHTCTYGKFRVACLPNKHVIISLQEEDQLSGNNPCMLKENMKQKKGPPSCCEATELTLTPLYGPLETSLMLFYADCRSEFQHQVSPHQNAFSYFAFLLAVGRLVASCYFWSCKPRWRHWHWRQNHSKHCM